MFVINLNNGTIVAIISIANMIGSYFLYICFHSHFFELMLRFEIKTLSDLFDGSVSKYESNEAYSLVNGESLSYLDVNRKVSEIKHLLAEHGLKKGDKVAILGQNMPTWSIAYFAITTLGLVAVPLLPDFTATEIANIIEHSEAKGIFVSDKLSAKLDANLLESLSLVVKLDDITTVKGDRKDAPLLWDAPEPQDLAVIIYTSGTTGKSKGVMLSHNNLASQVMMAAELQPILQNDVFLSILPLSHTYECSLGMLLPFYAGAAVCYLDKPPVASTLVPTLKRIRPTIILSVPLIIEKIYKNQILPKFTQSKLTATLYALPPLRKALNRMAGKKLLDTFGGRLRFFGIGGAKLDPVAEKFLLEAKFPIAIGYGLTETSPLIAGTNPQMAKHQSTGPAISGVEIRIDNPNPSNGEGEIVCKGPNVMQGYYKDVELTQQAFTSDGWFKTGDLGMVDKNGFLYIKGRLKNMIVGPSGENIYPEEIESVINEHSLVVESLVVEKRGKLVAMVHLNTEEIEKRFLHLKEDALRNLNDKVERMKREMHFNEKVEAIKKEIQEYVNSRVNKFSKISLVVEQKVQFEKTATHKIKRYLYCQ